jgi:hypothetical protein
MQKLIACMCVGLLSSLSPGEVTRIPHVEAHHQGIDAAQASALAETLAAARMVYIEQYGFDMPDKIILEVRCGPKESTRLYTDGQDHLFLSIPSPDKLARPAVTGVFNLYGMCHELGHMAMYRTLTNRDWMTSAAAEGWAHLAGSVVVDQVYAAKGPKLWPDPYDYREDGTARLRKQLADKSDSSPVTQGAGEWLKLDGIIGRTNLPKLFAAWQAAKIDPANPDRDLLGVLVRLAPDKKAALDEWWKTAGPLFVDKQARSTFKAETIAASQLSDPPLLLKLDDGASDGRQSIGGSGHARSFQAPAGGPWYITAVWVQAARYGGLKPLSDTFDLALCDKDMAIIALWRKPYGLFGSGELKWERVPVPPTRAPDQFNICMDFKSTASKGVYLAYDSSTHGQSVATIPGKKGRPFDKGDWMIRVELSQPKDSNPLTSRPEAASPKHESQTE